MFWKCRDKNKPKLTEQMVIESKKTNGWIVLYQTKLE